MKNLFWLIILCAPLIVKAQVDHWETAIYASDFWKYKAGSPDIPENWNRLNFSDGSWLNGAGGIGYGDNDDITEIEPVTSLFLRKKFSVSDASKILTASLHADFDDGFVAYLNGYEIARSNMSGENPSWDAWADHLHEALLYQGGKPERFNVNLNTLGEALQNGNNVLAIQVHNYDGLASSDLSASFWLSFGVTDDSNDFGELPHWFPDPLFTSHLPILRINTFGEDIPNEPRIPGTMDIVWNGPDVINHVNGAPVELSGNITIEKRGQSSLYLFPKVGYTIETKDADGLDADASFLGFPAEEDWVLHGPYADKTLMRNVVAMHIANSLDQYASRTRFVELQINGYYEGIYVMMEKIKRDENRVDIAKLRTEDISGVELTGGYIFKIDKGDPDWLSQYDMVLSPGNKLHFQHVYPKRDNIMPEQADYIQSYVDSFENAVLADNYRFGGKRYNEYIDLNSFADQLILNEVTKNIDAYRYSSYYYKKKDSNGGKIHAGPAWDFNLGFGNADFCENYEFGDWMFEYNCHTGNPFWWGRMLEDPTFTRVVRCRWEELRQGPLSTPSLHAFIDETAEFLQTALNRNFERWPVMGIYVWPNPMVFNNYNEEVGWLKNFIGNRIQWMDENMFGDCAAVATEEIESDFKFTIIPNPTNGKFFIELNAAKDLVERVEVYNSLGVMVQTVEVPALGERVEVDLNGLVEGSYFVKMGSRSKIIIKIP